MSWRDDDERVVYLERNGGSGLKVFLVGALLGAGLALLYAPQSGKETRRALQRRLRKFRALAEEKLGDLTDRLSGEAHDLADAYREAMGEDGEAETAEPAPRAAKRGVGGAREELERRLAEARARRRVEHAPADEESGA